MAKGNDTRNHPGRKVDRAGWSAWTPSSSSKMGGNVVATSEHTYDPEYAHSIDVIQNRNDPGFSTELDYVAQVTGRGGIESEQYRAGPYRTQRRAEMAGRAMTNRVEAGRGGEGTSMRQTGSYYESPDERRANERGLL